MPSVLFFVGGGGCCRGQLLSVLPLVGVAERFGLRRVKWGVTFSLLTEAKAAFFGIFSLFSGL